MAEEIKFSSELDKDLLPALRNYMRVVMERSPGDFSGVTDKEQYLAGLKKADFEFVGRVAKFVEDVVANYQPAENYIRLLLEKVKGLEEESHAVDKGVGLWCRSRLQTFGLLFADPKSPPPWEDGTGAMSGIKTLMDILKQRVAADIFPYE